MMGSRSVFVIYHTSCIIHHLLVPPLTTQASAREIPENTARMVENKNVNVAINGYASVNITLKTR